MPKMLPKKPRGLTSETTLTLQRYYEIMDLQACISNRVLNVTPYFKSFSIFAFVSGVVASILLTDIFDESVSLLSLYRNLENFI